MCGRLWCVGSLAPCARKPTGQLVTGSFVSSGLPFSNGDRLWGVLNLMAGVFFNFGLPPTLSFRFLQNQQIMLSQDPPMFLQYPVIVAKITGCSFSIAVALFRTPDAI